MYLFVFDAAIAGVASVRMAIGSCAVEGEDDASVVIVLHDEALEDE